MTACLSSGCRREAVVCDECVRALALKWWGGIGRHGFVDTERCLLCELGELSWCAACALAGEHGVVSRRAGLREGKIEIGEPRELVGLTDHGTIEVNWRRFEQLVTAEKRAAPLAPVDEEASALGPGASSSTSEESGG